MICRRPRLLAALAAVVAAALGSVTAPATSAQAAEVRLLCFPVVEPVTYTRSFGAPRSGHTHEGTDIMGQKMHRLLSAVSGVVVDLRYTADGSGADNAVRIRADDGWYYAYLHMNNDSPGTDDGRAPRSAVFADGLAVGSRVQAGQFIGYLGDSGNAEGGGPHLHFEMRQPAPTVWQSVAVDGYDSLRAALRCHLPNAVTDLGGVAASDPDAAVVVGTHRVELVVRGTDDQTYTRTFDGYTWTPWATLGGVARSAPAVASPAAGRLTVFVRGTDDALWSRTLAAGGWGSWTSLGGVLTGDPDAASYGRGEVAVVVRGTDGAIWQRRQSAAGTWLPWTSLGGQTSQPPAVSAPGPDRYDVFARGTDDGLWGMPVVGGRAGGWVSLGGTLTSPPEAAAEAGVSHVVVLGTDDRMWHRRLDGTSPWTLVTDEQGTGGGALASWGPGRVDLVYVAKDDHALLHTWWETGSW